MLRIFLGEADQWQGEPLYEAIVKKLQTLQVAGATVYRGILGYGAKPDPPGKQSPQLSKDRPIMITTIDTAVRIAEAATTIEEMLENGLIVVSDVDIIRVIHSHPEIADADR
ncbi:MAG: DUF190 domain-containing protein [Bryobacteraceae bacterium]|nr:DUF190 domain-containing protein [Bryobacterales bacterium]MEB2363099.1 DUF190 domain-containing protein [Bryobacterales bacterium]NUN03976.1 DUF190 domain-containing protein [Bryobacteraceae bacterium]